LQNEEQQTKMHKTRITQRSRQKKRKLEKTKSRTKPRKQKQIQNKPQAKDMRRDACDLGAMGDCDEGGNQQTSKTRQLLAV